ncbi:hypothetical protein X737_31015 [Mesorhizobium sp. L48C026A00]|nr:hypothetical protein X737_31015 [Mesorhizobium sp. L48C026A00]
MIAINSILNRCASSGGSCSSNASRLFLPVDGIASATDGAAVASMIVEAAAKAAATAATVEVAARPSRSGGGTDGAAVASMIVEAAAKAAATAATVEVAARPSRSGGG